MGVLLESGEDVRGEGQDGVAAEDDGGAGRRTGREGGELGVGEEGGERVDGIDVVLV